MTIIVAREWKARCPMAKKEGFIEYLYKTGIKETSAIEGFKGAQIFERTVKPDTYEITLMTYWLTRDHIIAFAGQDIDVAKLYPEDDKYELDPDTFVHHYDVIENQWG